MITTSTTDREWQNLAVDRFMEMFQSEDGDFGAIARLSQVLSDGDSLQHIVDRLSRFPQCQQAFQTRPCLGNLNFVELEQLPADTLGHNYAVQMLKMGIMPLQIPEVDSDVKYLSAHITETHDLWHVVTGFDTDILGEIQLESFYMAQLEASRFWLALITKNLLKKVIGDIESSNDYLDAIVRGYRMGKHAQPLFGINWKEIWETPLADIRTQLNIKNWDI
jgi:ubiquinone biosynthesis protein Coq4